MLVENHDREGLTPTEEAVAIEQLAGFDGVTQRDITTMTGIKAGAVRTALKVAASEVATAIGERHDLSMDAAGRPGRVRHRHRGRQAPDRQRAQGPEPIRPPGGPATPRPRRPGRLREAAQPDHRGRCGPGRAGERLVAPRRCGLADELLGPEGATPLTPAKHRSCPGHAGAVREADDGYEVAYLCLDPVGHGHVRQTKGPACQHRAAPSGTGDDR